MLTLKDQLTPLLPRLGCGRYDNVIWETIDLSNNPVSSEMEKMLKEELRRRKEVRCYVNQSLLCIHR